MLSCILSLHDALPIFVVQDAYHPTETTAVADLILPAAQWSERDGTMTNSERRICLLERAGNPPGEALPDWQIICRVAGADRKSTRLNSSHLGISYAVF